MPYKSRYVDSGKGVHKVGYGLLTTAHLVDSAKRQVADVARARKLKYGLVDFSQVTELRLAADTFERWIEENRKLAAMTPGAFVAVVASTPLSYDLARLWQSHAADLGWNSLVFRERHDAILWLRKQLGVKRSNEDEYPSLDWELNYSD
ncbi:MAG TPA: hypothetical protein VHY09_08110 [Candidatus Methylacidiphilales bacterium]|nr:hypothetical protein [Candidatus Methylacidiphilales bacterium]